MHGLVQHCKKLLVQLTILIPLRKKKSKYTQKIFLTLKWLAELEERELS